MAARPLLQLSTRRAGLGLWGTPWRQSVGRRGPARLVHRDTTAQAAPAMALMHAPFWQQRRWLAKRGRRKAKEEQGIAAGAAEPDGAEDQEWSFDDLELATEAALEFLQGRMGALQTGRAVPALLESVSVEAYPGAPAMPLPQLGTISVRDTQTLGVQLYDESVGSKVVLAIQNAGLDLAPLLDGKSVTVPVPKMTAEGRQSVVKTVKSLGEAAKSSIQQARQKCNNALRSYGKSGVSKDEVRKLEKQVRR